ncbi:hypothetical protein [Marinobacterium arenosum]|uniref:hypothetical protein n=1 Tax=Marinobacterium arenosum TaxID=2862496 RepID=UPI001C95D08C|nr:hypothetical protein [Marinobacterium arenosum]MBY4676240.1 hypothetical protein [Marinobacterium arenosum]
MIDQQRRHQYLEALGISSWLPTRALPAAAPSDDWVWDFRYPAPEIPFADGVPEPADMPRQGARPDQSPASVPRGPVPAAAKAAAEQARAAINNSLSGDAPVAAKPQPKPSVAAEPMPTSRPSPKPAEIPRFRLAFVAIGDTLLVDSVPPAAASDFSSSQRRLLCNIAAYLGPRIKQCPEPALLPWPMLANSSLDQSRPQAVAAVQHKLNRLGREHQIGRILLLGQAAAQMALDREEPIDELRGIAFTVAGGAKAVATRSLTEALQLPEIKAEIWQDLQVLRKATTG